MNGKIIIRKETHEINILTQPILTEKRFCEHCFAEVRWLVPEEAMLLANASLREIFRLIETDKIHFVESAEGFLLVCAESLEAEKRK